MMTKSSVIICAILLMSIVQFVKTDVVIDHAGKFDNYACFKEQGYSQVIIRAYHSFGAIDYDTKENVRLSNAAGLATDLYMFPCRGKDGATQVKQLLTHLDSLKDDQSSFTYATGTIWIDVETNPSPGCSWTQGTSISNCLFLQTVVNQLKKNGRAVGIYASHYMWNSIFGSVDTCRYFTDIPLWYAHYDLKPSFDDWDANKFGGWVQPTLKQYTGNGKVCGLAVDFSFY